MASVTGLVIAGGKASRMGGTDKGLLLLNGRPMIEWVIDRLRPQVASLILNTNASAARYAEFGVPVIGDQITGHTGPLAGLHAGLAAATTPLLACVPCDAPLLPADLVERQYQALIEASADVAVVRTAGGLQPVFMLCRRELQGSIGAFLLEGGRALHEWLRRVRSVEVAFADDAAFANLNTPEELRAMEAKLAP